MPYQRELSQSFGQDLSGVRAHLGQSSALSNVSASGAAMDKDVAFASSTPSKGLVAHEVAHVIQQQRSGSASRMESELDAQRAAAGAEIGLKSPVMTSAKPSLQLNYATLSATGKENIDVRAQQKYAEKAEEFEYKLGIRLSTNAQAINITDAFLLRVKNIVDAWAAHTGKAVQTVYGQSFKFVTGDKYYGAFKMTGQNVQRVFDSLTPMNPNQPMRTKLKVIYNAVRNNNLAKWLKVASDDLLDQERHAAEQAAGMMSARRPQSTFRSDDAVRGANGVIDLSTAQYERVTPGFGQDSGLNAVLLANAGLRARVEQASAREKIGVRTGPPTAPVIPSHIGAPDMFSAIARGAPNESAQIDEANKDRQYNVNAGANLSDQTTLSYDDINDLTDQEKELLYERAGVGANTWYQSMFGPSRFDRLKTATGDHVQWEQGREAISVMINSRVDKQAQAIGARLEAGVSGSTAMMMAGAKNVGLGAPGDLRRLRLAMLGWMLPNHDHSFFEIMKAAETQGVPFAQNPMQKGAQYEDNQNYAPLLANTFQNVLPDNQFPAYFLSNAYKNTLSGNLAPGDVEPADFNVATMKASLIGWGFDATVINGLASRSVIDLDRLNHVVANTTYKDEAAAAMVSADAAAKARAANKVQHMHVRDSVPYRNLAEHHPAHVERWYGVLLNHHNVALNSGQQLLVAATDANLGGVTDDLATRTTGLEENTGANIDGIPADLLVGLNQNVIDDLVVVRGIVEAMALTNNVSLHVAPNKAIYEPLFTTNVWERLTQNLPHFKAWLMMARLMRRYHGDFFYRSVFSENLENAQSAQALQAGVPRKVVRGLRPVDRQYIVQLANDIHTIAGQPPAGHLAALNALGTTAPLSTLKAYIDTYIGANMFDVTVSSIAARENIDLSTDAVRTVHAKLGASLSPDLDINSPGAVDPQFTGSEVNESRIWYGLNRLFDWFGGAGLGALTAEEKAAIFVYTGPAGEGSWQNFLHSADVSNTVMPDGRTARAALIEEVPKIQTAISGLRKLPPYAGTVYNAQFQGPLNVPVLMQTYQVGSLHSKDNFFSTSRNNTNTFFIDPSYRVGWIVNKIKTGVDIRILSRYYPEDEVLFPPGASFVVTKVEDRTNSVTHPGGHGKVWVWLDEI
nr:DUF4157 domain-containing protein [Pleionea sp. CnH1-48]